MAIPTYGRCRTRFIVTNNSDCTEVRLDKEKDPTQLCSCI